MYIEPDKGTLLWWTCCAASSDSLY